MERQLPILILAIGGIVVLIISADGKGIGPLQVAILSLCLVAAASMWLLGRRSRG
jgi:hypothetical protein